MVAEGLPGSPAPQADEGRKRTFKKFTFRGVELDKLLDMKMDELVDLLHSRARRKFARGLKRGAGTLIKKIRKAKKNAAPGEKPDVVRTHLRDMVVLPEVRGPGPGRMAGAGTVAAASGTTLAARRASRAHAAPRRVRRR